MDTTAIAAYREGGPGEDAGGATSREPVRRGQRHELRGVVLVGHRDHDVLAALVQVGHRRAGRARGQRDFRHDAAGALVERAHPLAAATGGMLNPTALPSVHEQQRPGEQRRRAAHLPERRQVERLERGVIARAVAVRHHPAVLAGVQVDRGDAAVRRLR